MKGVNFLTALVDVAGAKLPVAVEFVKKDAWELDEKRGKQRRVSSKTKNELFREMIARCNYNFRFDYVVADSWYSSAANMELIKQQLHSNFIIALKSNRLVALSQADKESNNYVNIDSLQPEQSRTYGRGLVQRIRFSAVAGKASLQKRGWYSRRVVSGMQRFKFIV